MSRKILIAILFAFFSVSQGFAVERGPEPRFSPERFFSGRTEGRAKLTTLFSAARAVSVHGHGHLERDGTLVLDQRVEIGGDPPSTRQWRLQRVGEGRYAGTLTDASGPVAAEANGNRLTIRYRMKGGVRIEQTLIIDRSGRTVDNRLTVRFLGLPVARLHETISKVP